MNFQLDWASIQPFLGQLLQSPQFQAVFKKILDDIFAKINSGIHPDTAVKQAQGQIGAAALLHLTGNPMTDFQAFLKNLPLPSGSPTPPPGTFTS